MSINSLWNKIFRGWFPTNPAMYERPSDVSFLTFYCTYISSVIYLLFGWIHRYIMRLFSSTYDLEEPKEEGYAPLYGDFNAFYTRYLYGRIRDCWSKPISSTPGAFIDVMERTTFLYSPLSLTGKTQRCLNLGSYNYLGFAENSGACTDDVVKSIEDHSISACGTRTGLGNSSVHKELEQLVAQFLHKEAAIVFGMGFATNATSIPSLVSSGDLIISDANNHASLVTGMRNSGAQIKPFKHNDTEDLEKVLKDSIIEGQTPSNKGRKPWNRILIVVEGIYSMEGEILPLPEIVRIKKKYNAYLYVDEAHSIGALGPNGGGVTDYFGVDRSEVDILMGTFTKSFGSAGGYIASSKKIIDHIVVHSFASNYDTSMPPACSQQVLTSLRIIMGLEGGTEGQKRLKDLRENTNYFRNRMIELGFRVMGSPDSPVVPVLIYLPSAMAAFCRMCQENGIGCVVASYPATPVYLCRARFCISASHTRPDLEKAMLTMAKLGDICNIRYDLHKTIKSLPSQQLVEEPIAAIGYNDETTADFVIPTKAATTLFQFSSTH